MQTAVFLVADEPYCLWDADIAKRNIEFIEGLDADYFEYNLTVHTNSEDEKRASVALRVSLHHAIETLFSLIGAYVQAPECAYAWIGKYSNADLRKLVSSISKSDAKVFTKLNIQPVSWKTIAESIFGTYMPGTDRQVKTIEKFAALWQSLSNELTDQTVVDEYNSLKHGFRVKSGGFALAVGVESKPGVVPPSSNMHFLGQSNYGATFFRIENLWPEQRNRSIRSRRTSVNWSIERVALTLQLTHMSINNVVSALKIINRIAPSKCRFLRPEKDEDFEEPWKHSPGVTNINFDHVIDETNARPVTKKELLKLLDY